jgi:hypothetical protein
MVPLNNQFKAVLRELLERFGVLETGGSSVRHRGDNCDWLTVTIDIRPRHGTWQEAMETIMPMLRGTDELLQDDFAVAVKTVKSLLRREEAKYNRLLWENEHPDQQEKDQRRFQEGVVAGLLTAVEGLGEPGEPEKCCSEPKVRGGRCDNCGTWLAREEDWNDRVVRCLEMIVSLMQDGNPHTALSRSDYEGRIGEIEDFIVNHLGRE